MTKTFSDVHQRQPAQKPTPDVSTTFKKERLLREIEQLRLKQEHLMSEGRELVTKYNALIATRTADLNDMLTRFRQVFNAQAKCREVIIRILTAVAIRRSIAEPVPQLRGILSNYVDELIALLDSMDTEWREKGDPVNSYILGVMDVLDREDEGFADLLALAKRDNPTAYDVGTYVKHSGDGAMGAQTADSTEQIVTRPQKLEWQINESELDNLAKNYVRELEASKRNEVLNDDLETLDLPVRVYNALKRTRISNVSKILNSIKDHNFDELLAIRNFGKTSLNSLVQALKSHGYDIPS